MPSILEAIEGKYGLGCCDVPSLDEKESLVSIFVPKLPPLVCVPELLVLNDCDIDCAGNEEDLKKRIYTVKELDLAQNKLANWNEIFSILSHTPRVEFVNLSMNLLNGPVPLASTLCMTKLRSLVLNNTKLDWESVESLLKFLPVLEELHLSLNDYRNVLIDTLVEDDCCMANDFSDLNILDEEDDDRLDDETCLCGEGKPCPNNESPRNRDNSSSSSMSSSSSFPGSNSNLGTSYNRSDSTCSMYKKTNAHGGVKKLHFTGNPVQDWAEICRLGRVFPNLDTLVLAECPLKAVEAVPRPVSVSDKDKVSIHTEEDEVAPPFEYFQNLTFLNLSSTNINTWDDIDRLAQFPKLKNLRVQNWPLWDKCEATEYERRQLLIARLPYVETLNGGGVITEDDREDAERAFIRYYMDRPESDRPSRYNELIAKHGRLDPLVNIDLRPEKRVKVTFTYGDSSEVRSVDVYRTVIDLKTRLERIVGIPANKMRLFYGDQDLRDHHGPEEMKYPHKHLYSYNIQTGDEIIIDLKR